MITIIIPTYNRESLIARAITSVINQTYAAWELIIVDDGSTDNTREVVQQYLADQRIKYVHKENSGAAHSRNVGVENSAHDYITFLDSDDEAKANWLEKFNDLIVSKHAKVVCCGLIKVNQKNEVIKKTLPKSLGAFLYNKVGRFTGGVFIIRKEIFWAVGGYDNSLTAGQHTELSYRLIPYLEEQGIGIENIFEHLIVVHIHDGERIRHNHAAKAAGAKRVVGKHLALLKKDKNKLFNYFSIIGVNSMKVGNMEEARLYLYKAFITKPFNYKSITRLLLAYIKR